MTDEIQTKCDRLAAEILDYCTERNLHIACAESLTGGLLADAFIRIPGASSVVLGSAVTYDIGAKASLLGVDETLLANKGAVHHQVAEQMALGCTRLYAQQESVLSRGVASSHILGLSTTGVAGPGPDGDKPAGLVYIGIAFPAHAPSQEVSVKSIQLQLHGSREEVRRQTVLRILENVRQLTGVS